MPIDDDDGEYTFVFVADAAWPTWPAASSP
jgi:hypothetical protein